MTRIHSFLLLLCIAHLVKGSTVDSSCPDHVDSTRTIWGILESCALTLLICIWHAIHLDIPGPGSNGRLFFERVPWIFVTAFFAPEGVVSFATKQWCEAHRQVKDFRTQGYEWSMTHSYFVQMGGFVYDEGKEGPPEAMTSFEFLRRCEKGEIINPCITEKEIMAMSKSDGLGKAIFMVQLSWFTLQVIVRGAEGLAVTMVELDTVCMSALALLYLFFWWDKPHRPQSPHIFYKTQVTKALSKEELYVVYYLAHREPARPRCLHGICRSKAWMAEPSYLNDLISRFVCLRKANPNIDEEMIPPVDANVRIFRASSKLMTDSQKPDGFKPRKPSILTVFMEKMDPLDVQIRSLYLTWIILGGLHLIAWNWTFPTETEKIIWRVASLVLATSPLAFAIVPYLDRFAGISDFATYSLIAVGIIARALLVALMLASLRALPCSAYKPIDWTTYIPHL